MNEYENLFIQQLSLAAYGCTLEQIDKAALLEKYELLAGVLTKESQPIVIDNNLANFGILFNKTLFLSVLGSTPRTELLEYKNLHKVLTVIDNKFPDKNVTARYEELHSEIEKLLKKHGGSSSECQSIEMVSQALKTFGMDETELTDEEAAILDDDDLGDIEIDEDELFDSDDDIDIEDEIDTEDEVEEKDIEDKSDDEEKYAEAFRQIYEGIDEDSTTPLKVAIDGILKSFSDLYMSCFSGITTPDGVLTNNGLLSIERTEYSDNEGTKHKYKYLYNHSDINTKEVSVTDPKYIRYQQNSSKYGQYYKAIMYAIGTTHCGSAPLSNSMDKNEMSRIINEAVEKAEQVFGTQIDGRKGLLPKYNDAIQKISYYPRLHLQLMTGNYKTSDSMAEWVKENNVHKNAVRITNFDDIMKYARHLVSNCLTDALIDAGIKIEDAGENDNEVASICNLMSSQLKNIIVLTNTKKGYFTVKICSADTINSKALAEAISLYFNASSSGSKAAEVEIKNDGTSSGVIEYDIVLNRAEYDKASSFSADVIDDIIATGNLPSWSSAILGEKNDGGAMVYDFKKNYSISVYGSSGSGKGIMTSALLSNAIAEGCEIMYLDGKPDNGAALGKVAWDNGVDCAVFNANSGKAVGGTCRTFPDFLESYSHGIRSIDMRNNIISRIPSLDDNEDWPFKSYETLSRTILYEVSLALNGFKFVHDAIISRSQGNIEKNPDGSDRWAVFVIDEIENAASNEQTIRNKMKAYMDKIGEQEVYKEESKTDRNGNVTTQQKRDGKIKDPKNWEKDTGYLFCKQWLDWADNICANWDSVVTISLRNSSSTLITIFQTNKWFNQVGNVTTGKTKIGQLMLRVAPKTIKIVGRGGLLVSNQWGDDDPDSYTWKDDIDKGKWVIGSAEGVLKSSDTVFKPFKVFTTDLGDGVAVDPTDVGAGANMCYTSRDDIGKVTETGKLKKPLGLQSYLNYIFTSLSDEIQEQINSGKRMAGTDTPAGVLSTSLEYFDKLIRNGNTANGRGLIDRMYDVKPITNFSGQISSTELSNIQEREKENRLEVAQSELDALNSDELNIELTAPPTKKRRRTDAELLALVHSILSEFDLSKVSQKDLRQIEELGVSMFRSWGW